MARNKQAMVAVFVAAAAAAAAAVMASAAITCGQVGSAVAPCVSYVTGRGALAPACCNGVRSLNNAAQTTPDRQAVCRCLKSIIGSIKSINPGLVAGVPGKCGVNAPYPISASTDCNKIS